MPHQQNMRSIAQRDLIENSRRESTLDPKIPLGYQVDPRPEFEKIAANIFAGSMGQTVPVLVGFGRFICQPLVESASNAG